MIIFVNAQTRPKIPRAPRVDIIMAKIKSPNIITGYNFFLGYSIAARNNGNMKLLWHKICLVRPLDNKSIGIPCGLNNYI